MVIAVTAAATIREFVKPSKTGYPAGLSFSPVGPGAGKPRILRRWVRVKLLGIKAGGLVTTSVSHIKAAIVI